MAKENLDLGKARVGKLLFSLGLPAIIAQLVNVLYNIVDRIFIGRMENGGLAMAGIGVAMPIILIISAFSALIGNGGAPIVAIKMGEKNNKEAEKIMSMSFSVLIILAIILTTLFLIFKEPILWAFGASNETIKYSSDYLTIYLIGTIFVQISLGMNPFINTQGFAKIGMMTVSIGAVINIILDPILIFGFNMGIKGAALATITAQAISALWVLRFLLSKKSILKIRKKYLVPSIKVILPVIALGIAPFIMQSTESLVLISLNNQLLKYGGDLAVSAMTIMTSIMQFIVLPLVGLAQGAQPIISYNFGAKNIKRVKKAFKMLITISLAFTTAMTVFIVLVPEVFVLIFNKEPELVEITSICMKVYFFGTFAIGAQIACQQTFLALGQAKISMFLALLRKVILLVPLIFILPYFIKNGLEAVLLAEPIADILASITTVICFTIFYKKTLGKIDGLNNEKIVNN